MKDSDQKVGRRPTLSDVARLAEVSVQTASHVLSGTKFARVAQFTRDRVLKAAETVGYQPNRTARAMRSGRSQMCAVWMPMDRPNISYIRFLNCLYACSHRSGYDLLIYGLTSETGLGQKGPLPNMWPVDGIFAIDSGQAIRRFREDPNNLSIPVSILGYEEVPNGDSVVWNVLEAYTSATQRLLQTGSKHIVHLTVDWVYRDFPAERRLRGYREAVESAGLQPVVIAAPEESSASAAEALGAYIDQNGVPDGVMAFTDTLAIGAAQALLARSVRIPQDCQIFGFGDFPEGASFSIPISTFRSPIPQVVEKAWSWLLERIQDPTIEPRSLELPMDILVRDSVRSEA